MEDNANQQRPTNLRAAKLELLKEKQIELEELIQIDDQSARLGQHFEGLADHIQTMSNGSQTVAEVVGNWDYVFRTMGVMNTESGQAATNPTIINLPI